MNHIRGVIPDMLLCMSFAAIEITVWFISIKNKLLPYLIYQKIGKLFYVLSNIFSYVVPEDMYSVVFNV